MNIREFYVALSGPARAGLLAGALLIAALTVATLWWVFGGSQQLLFGNLRQSDAAEIVEALNEWKVPHEIIDGGAGITVDTGQVHAVRMRLVAEGVPKGGHVGFELFNDSDFGVTEFAQRVNFQRALQGELERTISSLPGVVTARVHLTIRRPGLFVGQAETSKASVAVSLEPGHHLNRAQVGGIRNLVAAAVEGLTLEQVSVLDSSGTLLAGNGAHGVAVEERVDEEARLEARIQARVTEMLERVVANEEFHVSVDVSLNFDAVRQVSERPLSQGLGDDAVLVRKRVNSSDAPANGRSQNHEEAEYAHGTAREEISRAPGRVERMSIAVLLPPVLDETEVERIRSLVAAASGIEESRGDRLEVSRLTPRARRPSASAPAATAAAAANEVSPATPDRFVWGWWKLVVVGAVVLLVGTILVVATSRQPKKLTRAEREAVVVKLRSWLAEERLPS